MKPMSQKKGVLKGSCLCGKIRFKLKNPFDNIWFCHCSQCRKNYGMYGAFLAAPREGFSIIGKTVKKYKSSQKVARSFCSNCGSPISWDYKDSSKIYVLAGLVNGKTEIKKGIHIFTKDKGDYYQIHDAFPKFKTVPK